MGEFKCPYCGGLVKRKNKKSVKYKCTVCDAKLIRKNNKSNWSW